MRYRKATLREAWLKALKRFFCDDQGLETIEYAVMTALIVAALISAFGLLAAAMEGRFTGTATTVDGIG